MSKRNNLTPMKLFKEKDSTSISITTSKYYNRKGRTIFQLLNAVQTYTFSLSITGLRNLGNTCYINSMIQCLFAAKTFRTLFISSKYKSYLQPIRSNGSHYSPKLSNSLSMLFNKMYLNGGCSVVPTGFLKVINQLRPDLKIPDDNRIPKSS